METLLSALRRVSSGKKGARIPPEAIPCNETSDAGRLCRHPLVSVCMTTYNQAGTIREAIESVLAQLTDFEYEVVIGEDCSSDRTRDICLEYQRRFPDRVRVLWSEENVYRIDGNAARVEYRSRGDYLAYCEGDDYWTDPLKLQKQVDLMRRTGAVLCVAYSVWKYPDREIRHSAYEGKTLLDWRDVARHYFHTTTYLVNRKSRTEIDARFPKIYRWYDTSMVICLATLGTVCLLPETVSVYRITGTGTASSICDLDRGILACGQFYDLLLHGPGECRDYFLNALYEELEYAFNPRNPDSSALTVRHGWDYLLVRMLLRVRHGRVKGSEVGSWRALARDAWRLLSDGGCSHG